MGNPDDRLNKQHAVVLTGEVGLSERFSIQALLPVRTVDLTGREELSTEGIGDVELTLRTSLTDPERSGRLSAVAYYGAALPTGKDSEPEVLEQNAQFSRGVLTGIAGGEVSVKVLGESQIYARAETQIPTGDDDGYRFAATRSVSALFSSPFGGSTTRWLAGLELRYAGRDEARCLEDGDPRPACDPNSGLPQGHGFLAFPNRGGHQKRLLGGVLFGLTRQQNVGLIVGRLLDANLAGDQLVARTEYVVGWQGTFGTHRHPVD